MNRPSAGRTEPQRGARNSTARRDGHGMRPRIGDARPVAPDGPSGKGAVLVRDDNVLGDLQAREAERRGDAEEE